MSLVNELIKDLLPEKQEYGKTVAVYGGGFKPATKGHFEVVKQALKQNPEIDEFIIFIGGKEREGITKEEATLIWDLYEKYLPMGKIKISSSNKPPIRAIYNYASDNPTEKVLFILGAREGNEDDFSDITNRTKALDDHPNMSLRTIVTQEGASGTAARNALKVSYEKFEKFLPNELEEKEKKMIYNMLSKKYVAESLEDWFEKEDWVRINTSGNITGPCGTMKKGKPTTRCLPRKKAQSLTKAERKATVAKKVRGSKKGKQFVKNTKKGKVKLEETKPNIFLIEDDPKKGTGKKPKGSGRRLYTDEDPKDTIGIKFSTRQDIVNTLAKKSFKAKSHARQSQIINLIHQRVRAALGRTKDPKKKKRLQTAFKYILKRKEASKAKTKRLNKQKNENVAPNHKGKAAPYGSGYKKFKLKTEKKGFGKSSNRYRAIYKKDGKFYYMQDNPFSPGIRQEFGPFKTKAAAKRKMGSFPPGTSYRDITEIKIDLSNYDGQILPGDVLRAPKGFPLSGKKLDKSIPLKVIKNSREGVNRYKLSLEDKDGKKYSVRNYEMDGEYKGKKLPKWGLVRKSKKNVDEGDTYEKMAAKGEKAGTLKQGTVRKRLGIPKDKKIPLSLINKEISRLKKMDKDPNKKGAQLGDKNQKYYKALQLAKTLKTTTNLNEALDPKTFDFTPHIKSLTIFMEDNGLKLQPYPKIRFIHSDVDNGTNLLGRTAYYTPDNNEIVLYTYGRHPKDILRSYAHELVHVHQNMEDRLDHTQTTNVNQDDYLKELEKEAYETGNILFRSWSDTLIKEDARKVSQKNYADYHKDNKKKVKDPFGIMAYAAELGRLREDDKPKLKVYLDMDGVIANFDKRFKDLSGYLPQPFVNKYGLNAFWDLIDEKHKVAFWRGIEIMPGAKQLVDAAKEYDYELLTAPSIKKQSRIGKNLWVQDKVGTLFGSKPKVNFRKAKEKHMIKPELTKSDVLIDDRADTIERWERAGGTGIQYFTANQAISDLKDLKV